jgi:PAS domain S-box-containing protein
MRGGALGTADADGGTELPWTQALPPPTAIDRGCAVASESTFEEMKRYVCFRAAAAPHFPRIAAEFYERIREHEAAHAVLTDEPQIERLQRSLVRWLDRLCSGPYDEGYVRETAAIGRVHVRIGLPQRYLFTAMALIRVALARIADAAMAEEAPAVREAITRVLDLELGIMLEAYCDDFVARLHNLERLETQQADRAPRRADHRYVNAVELSRALIVGLDAHGAILLFNREAERVTGFARDEVLGRPFADVFAGSAPDGAGPTDRAAALGAIIAGAAAGQPLAADAIEAGIQTRAGKLRDVRWQLAYAPSAQPGDEVVLFAFGRDVTDDNALAARARQSDKLAAVGTLAAGLAHEIRNPLNGAQLHVTFLERGLRKGAAEPEALEAVGVIRDEIKRLSTLVTEFLDFARPRPLERKPTSLRALCERTVALLAPQADAAKVSLDTQYPPTDPVVDLDPAKMQQVLLNLGQNAIEALAPAGGGTVTFRLRRQPRHVTIDVEDDGPGLPDPDAPIFDPFFSTKPSGTGLGLAIAHRIVTDHDGAIDIRRAPGKTIFQILMPLSEVSANDGGPRSG